MRQRVTSQGNKYYIFNEYSKNTKANTMNVLY